MKYQININQAVLADTNLDLTDAAILDYLIFYCNSLSPKVEEKRLTIEGKKYTWIRYENILLDMPMLRIKEKKALTRRILKLVENGYIKTHRQSNIRQYYLLTEKAEHIYLSPDSSLYKDKPVYENTQVSGTKVHSPVLQSTQDKDTIDKETNDNTVNGEKSLLRKKTDLVQDETHIDYLSKVVYQELGDLHSMRYYRLVVAKVPESVIRETLSEIKVDGAKSPRKVFTYRMEKYAFEH